MKTTGNIFRTLLLAVLTLTFGSCSEDSLLSELGLDGQTTTRTDGVGEVWNGNADTSWYQADATEFQIATAEQLAGLAQLVNAGITFEGKTIKLTADILLNDISNWTSWNESTAPTNAWTPIGTSYEQSFTGTLDGDGHSVSGIYIYNSGAEFQGLVGYLGEGGTLQNLGVKASYIKGGNSVGGLCGYNEMGGNISNCYNTGSVTGTGNFSCVGGVCGENTGTVSNCYNTGSVAGISYVGGVCGRNNGGTVSNCYNTGSIIGTGNNVNGVGVVGGVCGENSGTVTNCYNTGGVEGTSEIGGVCGTNSESNSIVANCYNIGTVTGTYSVGGVCGLNGSPGATWSSTITNCYNAGSVTGTTYGVGGVCGENREYCSVSNCYNIGSVTRSGTGSGSVGGVCGGNSEEKTTVANCYYLTGTAAGGIGSGSGEATAKTAAEFASGEVAYLLSTGKNGEIWGQNISFDPKDTYPVLGGLKVVQSGEGSYTNELSNKDGDFYLISTADELRLFASMVNSGQPSIKGKLTADIELNDIDGWENWGNTPPANSWTPIGNYFTGTFDGQGHTISGLYIIGSDYSIYYAGLFGSLEGGTVENVGVTKSYIQSSDYTGGIVGLMYGGTIRNCYCTGIVRCQGYGGGGIVGMNHGYDNSTIENCYFAGRISSEYGSAEMIGPIVGGMYAEYVNPTNCFYLEGCGASGKGTSKTAKQFQSGEVASLLGEGWGQTIGTDDYPVLTTDANKKVYAYTMYQGQSQSTETGYANNNGNVDLDLASHPNTIAVFEASGTFSGTNIVVKDGYNSYTCANLVLTDGADFYTPVKFTATKATYTRSPKVWAVEGSNGIGWETLCLPFSGTLYADDVAKQPVLTDLAGDYWLRSLTDFKTPNTLIFASGSTATAADNQIKAGVPYIIALPGETFGGKSLEEQTISVRGTNVTVINTAQSVQPEGSLFAFTGTFATKACDAASYRLNSENGSNGAGNLFVLDTNKLAPFRCRIDVIGINIGGTSRSASSLPRELRIGQ